MLTNGLQEVEAQLKAEASSGGLGQIVKLLQRPDLLDVIGRHPQVSCAAVPGLLPCLAVPCRLRLRLLALSLQCLLLLSRGVLARRPRAHGARERGQEGYGVGGDGA